MVPGTKFETYMSLLPLWFIFLLKFMMLYLNSRCIRRLHARFWGNEIREELLEQIQESRIERKKKAARKRILTAAEQLFVVEHSYEEATIREIADLADVSIGTVYSHFKTKARILAELISINTERIKLRMREAIPQGVTGAEQMEAFLSFFEKLRSDPIIALYCRLPPLTGQMKENPGLEEKFSGFRTILADILRNGNTDGTIGPIKDPDITAAILMNISLSFILDLELEAFSFAHTPLLRSYDSNTILLGFYDLVRAALGMVSPKKQSQSPTPY
jgi:AcrR family transcriptional regulator